MKQPRPKSCVTDTQVDQDTQHLLPPTPLPQVEHTSAHRPGIQLGLAPPPPLLLEYANNNINQLMSNLIIMKDAIDTKYQYAMDTSFDLKTMEDKKRKIESVITRPLVGKCCSGWNSHSFDDDGRIIRGCCLCHNHIPDSACKEEGEITSPLSPELSTCMTLEALAAPVLPSKFSLSEKMEKLLDVQTSPHAEGSISHVDETDSESETSQCFKRRV